MKIAELHKINFGGLEIADSEYRIGQFFLQQNQKRKDALNSYLRHAF